MESDANDTQGPPIDTIINDDVEDQPVPKTKTEILNFSFDKLNPNQSIDRIISWCTVRMAKRNAGQIQERYMQIIHNILKALTQLPAVDLDLDKTLRISDCLRAILGETPMNFTYEYPIRFQHQAAQLLKQIELTRLEEQGLEEITFEQTGDRLPPHITTRRAKTLTDATTNQSAGLGNGSTKSGDVQTGAIMRGIVVGKSKSGHRTYKLDMHAVAPPKDCNIVGHNGLVVGQWWPYRICAIRDGAHGASMGGIAGGATTGAYSVVVSGGYEELDQDMGNVIYYSGSNSEANTDPRIPVLSYATKALRRSLTLRRSIRVIRTAKAGGTCAPSVGMRYDGLYTITGEEVAKNRKGGAFYRFRLERDQDQAPIDLTRPNAAERHFFHDLQSC